MLARWGESALTQVEWLVEDGTPFTLSSHLHALADAERTAFAGRVGAGVTDLLMNALGYLWRDNASCLSASLAPHADFIYADGAVTGHGVVLAEAHGSFAAGVTSAGITGKAKRKYRRQVRPHLALVSPHGNVIHGYSIAFGSRPGTPGAFLHVAETLIAKPRGGGRGPTQNALLPSPQTVPTSLALSSHRSNFSLMDAPSVARWIDWVYDGAERPDDTSPLTFVQIRYAGRTFLACTETQWPFGDYPQWLDASWPPMWRPPYWRAHRPRRRGHAFAGWFVMEEKAAMQFLDSLSRIIRDGRESLPSVIELARIDPAGFGIGDEAGRASADSDYRYAVYGDGLALLDSPAPSRITGGMAWWPKDGIRTD
jgi:hypothetical protein